MKSEVRCLVKLSASYVDESVDRPLIILKFYTDLALSIRRSVDGILPKFLFLYGQTYENSKFLFSNFYTERVMAFYSTFRGPLSG